MFLFLSSIFLLLAWKFPFRNTSLVPNLEPGPDTFYYSVPAWNFAHGNGFKMTAYGVTKNLAVKPLYGLSLIPLFYFFNDVRAFVYLNLFYGIASVLLLMLFVKEIFKKSKYRDIWILAVGIVWVTNFYAYNLPSLLMSENMVVPITLLLGYLLVAQISVVNVGLLVFNIILLWFSKSSNLPMIVVAGLFLLIKIILYRKSLRISKMVLFIVILVSIFIGAYIFWPYRIYLLSGGNNWASILYFKQHFLLFVKTFFGGSIRYLWYDNQLISPLIGCLSIIGLVLGAMTKKYRFVSTFILLSVLINIIFFSFFYSAEGRYLSTVVPLYLVGLAIGWEIMTNRLGKMGPIALALILGVYFLARVNINGFYERKLTTLKRQAMNNFVVNEQPWNYMAILEYNKFFTSKNTNCYLGSLLNYYYFHLTFNQNCNYLPISEHQDFGDGEMIMDNIYKISPNLVDYYKFLVKNKNEVYISNYYGSADRGWAADFQKLMNTFEVKRETEGCLGNCSIYRLIKLRK